MYLLFFLRYQFAGYILRRALKCWYFQVNIMNNNNNDCWYDPVIIRPLFNTHFCIYYLGPCGGKTTGQARLCTFFENLGWKVNERVVYYSRELTLMTYITGLSCSGDCDSSFKVCQFSFISMTNELMIIFFSSTQRWHQVFRSLWRRKWVNSEKKSAFIAADNYFIAYILFCISHSCVITK